MDDLVLKFFHEPMASREKGKKLLGSLFDQDVEIYPGFKIYDHFANVSFDDIMDIDYLDKRVFRPEGMYFAAAKTRIISGTLFRSKGYLKDAAFAFDFASKHARAIQFYETAWKSRIRSLFLYHKIGDIANYNDSVAGMHYNLRLAIGESLPAFAVFSKDFRRENGLVDPVNSSPSQRAKKVENKPVKPIQSRSDPLTHAKRVQSTLEQIHHSQIPDPQLDSMFNGNRY